MKIKFKGIVQENSGGCPVCGKKRKGKYSFVSTKLYALPSGRTIMFRAGAIEEVTDSEGEYLLKNMYMDSDGTMKPVFEEA